MKIIVTHNSPDLDAVVSSWLVKKFFPDYSDAVFRFVPAGTSYEPSKIEKIKNARIIHVDTGFSQFDHHQYADRSICAATLVLDYLEKNVFFKKNEALRRLVNIVLEVDHFGEVFWDEADNDRYDFFLEDIFDGLKLVWRDQDLRLLQFGFDALNGIYQKIQVKVKAEREFAEARIVETPVGKLIGFETLNDTVLKLAQKKGYQIVVRKDPRKGYVRIKTLPNDKFDLEETYFKLKELDPSATWFLHSSHCLLLNGSTKNPTMKPTKLALSEVLEVLEVSAKKNG